MKSERQSLQHGNNFTHHGSALQRWATRMDFCIRKPRTEVEVRWHSENPRKEAAAQKSGQMQSELCVAMNNRTGRLGF